MRVALRHAMSVAACLLTFGLALSLQQDFEAVYVLGGVLTQRLPVRIDSSGQYVE